MYNFNNKNKINFVRNKAGMSLIEIMVAIMILGVTFTALISAFPFALRIIDSAEDNTRASYYAQEKIEEIYQYTYDSIATGTIEVKHYLGATSTVRGQFQRETSAVYVNSGMVISPTDLGLKKITTSIYYIDSISKNEEIFELSTVISSRQ